MDEGEVPTQSLLVFIQDELSKGSGRGAQKSRGTPSFFKVPVEQRLANPKAYDPFSFAFGPYHAKIDLRSDADYFKLEAVTQLLGKEKFELLVDRIEEHEPSIKALYVEGQAHLANINRRTLANLLAVDGVTIFAGLRDDVFQMHERKTILHDAYLLENQIPLFVIQYASVSIGGYDDVESVVEAIVRTYVDYSPFYKTAKRPWTLPSSFDVNRSLLSCIYDGLTANGSNNNPVSRGAEDNERSSKPYDSRIPTASHLRRCGINFRYCDGSFDGITFDNQRGILNLPRISFGDGTQRFLLNLVAHEITCRSASHFPVVSYLMMMDWLLDDEEDVKVLVDCGVIWNVLGSDRELADVWNKLCVHLPFELTDEDKRVVKDVNRMSQKKWRKWTAAWKEKYLQKQPWWWVLFCSS